MPFWYSSSDNILASMPCVSGYHDVQTLYVVVHSMILPCNWKDGPATNPGTRPANHSLLPEQDRPPNRVDASGHWTKADTRDDLGVPAEGRIGALNPDLIISQ